MADITAWYIHGISGEQAPENLADLPLVAQRSVFDADTLLRAAKWDYLIRAGAGEAKAGFVPLKQLAATRRGIATGANAFFHLTSPAAARRGLLELALTPCVGRAADVLGFAFTETDLAALKKNNRRVHLVNIGKHPTANEQAYIAAGEASGLQRRYLLAARKPWYSMERQLPAPIWAAVFGRTGLRFVHNLSGALTLTTFHCIYPFNTSEIFAAALTLCLNLPSIQSASRAHTRVYGGGLLKCEPKDLLEITVPDLRRISPASLQQLAQEQKRISATMLQHAGQAVDWSRAEHLVAEAAAEAAKIRLREEVEDPAQEELTP